MAHDQSNSLGIDRESQGGDAHGSKSHRRWKNRHGIPANLIMFLQIPFTVNSIYGDRYENLQHRTQPEFIEDGVNVYPANVGVAVPDQPVVTLAV